MARKLGGIQQRGRRSFRITYYNEDGLRQFETIKANNLAAAREEAERALAMRLGDLARGLPVSSRPNTILFDELAAAAVRHYQQNKLRSASDFEARLRLHLLPVFGHRRAAKITTTQLNSYINMRLEQGAKNGTINREFETLRRCYKLGMQSTPAKVVVIPHIPMLKEDNVRKGFFEPEQLEALCAQLPKHLVPVVRFGYLTGWRFSEVISRRWKHVDFKAKIIRLEAGETKNGKGREFPMFDVLEALIQSLRPEKTDQDRHIFLTEAGDPIRRFDKAWATACEKAGLGAHWTPMHDASGTPLVYQRTELKGEPRMARRPVMYFHDFRRTAYRNMVRMGTPQSQARQAVGWIDAKTAERYNITAKADLDVLRNLYNQALSGAKNGANMHQK